jgi:hypothetical protein
MATNGAVHAGDIIRPNAVVSRGQETSARDHHDIEVGWVAVLSENLTNHTLGPVSFHGSAELLCRSDPETRRARFPRKQEHRHETALSSNTTIVDLLKFLTPPQAAVLAKTLISGPDEVGHPVSGGGSIPTKR